MGQLTTTYFHSTTHSFFREDCLHRLLTVAVSFYFFDFGPLKCQPSAKFKHSVSYRRVDHGSGPSAGRVGSPTQRVGSGPEKSDPWSTPSYRVVLYTTTTTATAIATATATTTITTTLLQFSVSVNRRNRPPIP